MDQSRAASFNNGFEKDHRMREVCTSTWKQAGGGMLCT